MGYVTFDSLHLAACQPRPAKAGSSGGSTCRSPRRVSDPPQSSPPSPPLCPRDEILRLGALVGHLCSAVLTAAPLDPPRDALSPEMEEDESFPPTLADGGFWAEESQGRSEVAVSMGSILLALFVAARACRMDLRTCILKKMELNNRKYPVELCKGKSGKYTVYSDHTGITKTEGQSTVHTDPDESLRTASTSSDSDSENIGEEEPGADTIEGITLRIRRFATDRSWSRYHTPRNIVLALMGELGELAELFQWKGDAPSGAPEGLGGWSDKERDTVGQELADVSIYLLRLADVCGVQVGTEAMRAVANAESSEDGS